MLTECAMLGSFALSMSIRDFVATSCKVRCKDVPRRLRVGNYLKKSEFVSPRKFFTVFEFEGSSLVAYFRYFDGKHYHYYKNSSIREDNE